MPFPVTADQHGSLAWLRQQVGGYLGMGYDANAWGYEKTSKINSYIQSGVMQVYYPPPIQLPEDKTPGEPHRWSFLTPVGTLNLISNVSTYDLPASFSGVVGEISLTLAGTTALLIPIVPEPQLRQLQTLSAPNATPSYAAVRPKPSDGTAEQVYEIVFYPTPSANAQASFKYSVTPPMLSDDNPYPLGGRQFAELMLQSSLAVAEERTAKGQGVAQSKFMTLLQAAIAWDQQSLQTTDANIWTLEDETLDVNITRAYLKKQVGLLRGYGPNVGTWTKSQSQEMNLIIKKGMLKFFHPQLLPGELRRHEWSFLRPRATLLTVADQSSLELPANFANLAAPLTFAPSETVIQDSLPVIDEYRMRSLLQRADATGRPEMVAICPRGPEVPGNRYEILFYPVPDAEYEISYRYQINPTAGTDETELIYGGQAHAQTLVEACLAASEEYDGTLGVHSKMYIECLRSSVTHDRQVNATGDLGYNGDPSHEAFDTITRDDYRCRSGGMTTYTGYDIS